MGQISTRSPPLRSTSYTRRHSKDPFVSSLYRAREIEEKDDREGEGERVRKKERAERRKRAAKGKGFAGKQGVKRETWGGGQRENMEQETGERKEECGGRQGESGSGDGGWERARDSRAPLLL
ncbi:unnamed protein product [Pleuronectes platessa]|uniref:Uncharacterized protein n=1 Tax=Pleuronectes platessa TaxID=8262 RepID=A0A9N7YGH9_PLEPL|nr:unnamed protein product [Pleuronectes platessa]